MFAVTRILIYFHTAYYIPYMRQVISWYVIVRLTHCIILRARMMCKYLMFGWDVKHHDARKCVVFEHWLEQLLQRWLERWLQELI